MELDDLERLPARPTVWQPVFLPVTMQQLSSLLAQGLVTQQELELWSQNRLPAARQKWIDQRLSLVALDTTSAPVQ